MPGHRSHRSKPKGRRRSRFKPEMLSKSTSSTFSNGRFNNIGRDMVSIGHDVLSIVIQIGDMNIPNKTCIEVRFTIAN